MSIIINDSKKSVTIMMSSSKEVKTNEYLVRYKTNSTNAKVVNNLINQVKQI